MKRTIHTVIGGVLAVAASACAGFESSSTVTAPDDAAAIASLMGDWGSTTVATLANSCTNFRWKITAQSGNSVTGEVSAICANGITVEGTISGQVNGSDVPYQINGSASVANVVTCPFSLNGTAHIESADAIRIPYSGNTCLGPLSGEEMLRRPTTPSPSPEPAPTPDPTPEPTPPPASNPYHVGPGDLSAARAQQVIEATGREFPDLTAPRATEAEGVAAAEQLLRRMIWHLHLAGFDAGRQRNPSGAISNDKLTIFINGAWHAYDCFRDLGGPGRSADVIFWEVFPAGPVGDGGIPD
jgi:hypothetical protein